MSPKHARASDLPHPRVKGVKHFTETARARERSKSRGDYDAQAAQKGLSTPRRPVFCLLYEDLNDDQSETAIFGMYPRALISKLLPWLRCKRSEILHVCSGGLPRGEGVRVDMRAAARPDIIADGRHLPLGDGSVAAVLLDPPYTANYARELYGVEYPLPAHLLREAARVVRPGGRIGFVHHITPNAPPHARHVKTFGLSIGFGYPMRAVTIYEREQASLPGIGDQR